MLRKAIWVVIRPVDFRSGLIKLCHLRAFVKDHSRPFYRLPRHNDAKLRMRPGISLGKKYTKSWAAGPRAVDQKVDRGPLGFGPAFSKNRERTRLPEFSRSPHVNGW